MITTQSAGAVEFIDCISLQRSKILPPNKCPGYDIKQSDGEAPALEIWGMWSTLSLPLLPGPLWPGVVAPDWVLSIGQIKQTVYKQMTGVELWLLYSNTWKYLTVYKKEHEIVEECYVKNVFTNYIHIWYKSINRI